MTPLRWLDRLSLRPPAPEESATWEVEHHLAELADRLVADGWSEGDARREAERRFGDRRRYVPSMTRLERGRMAMERRTRAWDLALGSVAGVVRTGRRYPGLSAGVVATLALGIGANATMYGIVDRLLLQPPMHILSPEQVKRVVLRRPNRLTGETLTGATLTYPDYVDLKAHGQMDIAAYGYRIERTIGSGPDATRASTVLASAEFFPLLGVTPTLGRFWDPDEASPGAPLTAVISEEYWERAYGAEPDVLGRRIEIGGDDHTILGVAPEGFTGINLEAVDIWRPLEAAHVVENGGDQCLTGRGCWWMSAVARLHGGGSVDAAEAEATGLHHNGRRDMIDQGRYPEESEILLTPVVAAAGPEPSDESRVAKWLTGVSLIVLLIACANVANLLLARGTRQRREVAVRLALGAGRRRLVGQMIFESVLLSLVGGGLGLVLARWGGGFVRSTLLPDVHFPNSAMNGRVLVFTLATAVLAGLITGISPALQSTRKDVGTDLTDVGRGPSSGRSRLRGALTVFQAAMSVVLLVGAGLFVRSLTELRSLDLGMDVDRLLMVELDLIGEDLGPAIETDVYAEAQRRVATLPTVESVAATGVPFRWAMAGSLRVPGLDSIPTLPGGGPYNFPVSPGYFETVGLEVRAGRGIEAADGRDGELVAVVSETMARTLWPDGEALGRCLVIDDAETCTAVVGVVEDAARGGYQDEPYMAYYPSLAQMQDARWVPRALYVRASRDVQETAAAVGRILRTASPRIRYANVRSVRDILDPQARSWTLGAAMFSVFGFLALTLAAIGLYSVLAFDVAQRTRELGIRTALGAKQGRLLRSVLVQGGRLGVGGVLLGLAAAYFAAPRAQDLLFQVSPRDSLVLTGVGLALAAVSVAASLIPGLRATRVDPVEALRGD